MISRIILGNAAANTAFVANISSMPGKRAKLIGLQCAFLNSDATGSQVNCRMGNGPDTGHLKVEGARVAAASTININFVSGGNQATGITYAAGELANAALPVFWWETDFLVKIDTTAAVYQISNVEAIVQYE